MITSYVLLKKAINNTSMSDLTNDINKLIFVLVLIFTLSTIYMFGLGSYYKFLFSKDLRQELELIITPLFDLAVLVVILFLQNRNFG